MSDYEQKLKIRKIAFYLWSLLDDVTIDEDEKIDVPFLHFLGGTPREDIWHWFEDTFDVPVAQLMGIEKPKIKINLFWGVDGVPVIEISTYDYDTRDAQPTCRVYLNDGVLYENPPHSVIF